LKGKDPVQPTRYDCGNVSPITNDIEKNHRRAIELVRNGHRACGLSVVVGGGHDHGYSHLLGVYQALVMNLPEGKADTQKIRIGCINIDAHLDVRKPSPVITSGSPFYLAIESELLEPRNFVEFGIQSHCNGSELWDYIANYKIKVVPFEDLRHDRAVQQFKTVLKKLSANCDAIVVSLDMDAAAACYAPGVSAPQAEGFTSTQILELMEAAGDDPKVASLGIFELNPEHDEGGRTSLLAATSAYHFIARALRR
jgi:arginase family enzyme